MAWRWFVRMLYRNPALWVDEADILGSTIPRGVGCEITNVCNADCSFCAYGKDGGDPRKKRKLKMEVLRHTARLYSEAGGGMFTLSPILGEVSADKRWLEMVREICSYPNITGVSCYSNAILLNRFGSKNILTSGIKIMNISTALGSAEMYSRLYGVDKYDVVVENMLDLIRTNNDLGRPVDLTLQLRIDKPFSSFFDSPLYSELRRHIEAERIIILDDAWDSAKGLIDVDNLPSGHKFKEPISDKSVPCEAPFRKLEVLMDGTIQGCACRVEPELWAGNILDYNSIEEAWRSPGLVRLRNNWIAGKIPECCKTCTHYLPYTTLIRTRGPLMVTIDISRKIKRRLIRLLSSS
jgi:hypothetical protein